MNSKMLYLVQFKTEENKLKITFFRTPNDKNYCHSFWSTTFKTASPSIGTTPGYSDVSICYKNSSTTVTVGKPNLY
jgi:hypothetical protein